MQEACATLNENVGKMHEALIALNSECLDEIAAELQQSHAENQPYQNPDSDSSNSDDACLSALRDLVKLWSDA
jgi:hypothetical protein